MSDLWIFGRRPTARVRYRHGGFNATFPMNFHTVAEQVGLFQQQAAAKEAAETARRNAPNGDGQDTGNVIAFQPRTPRGTRSSQGNETRHGRRPTPFSGPGPID